MTIGYVGREPEMRYTPSGKPVTSFSVATTRSWTAPDGRRREETDWFNVVSWGDLAEICKQHLAKDQRVYIEGRLQTRGWEDNEGKRHYRTEIVANEMIILSPSLQHQKMIPQYRLLKMKVYCLAFDNLKENRFGRTISGS
jgi:single-strand DNA-binding protein